MKPYTCRFCVSCKICMYMGYGKGDFDIAENSAKRLDLTDISDYNSTGDFVELVEQLSYWRIS